MDWEYSSSEDDNYDPYAPTDYGICNRGFKIKYSGWCCILCEKDRMNRRKIYNQMKQEWFMEEYSDNFCPLSKEKPAWSIPGFFDNDKCFNDFRYTFVKETPINRPLSLDWKVLDLIPPKTLKEVKKQYHKMIRIHHPDKGGDHNKFIEIQNSYNNLISIVS
jgi:hypothetical protein